MAIVVNIKPQSTINIVIMSFLFFQPSIITDVAPIQQQSPNNHFLCLKSFSTSKSNVAPSLGNKLNQMS
jgi:hypothetical protein